MTSKNTLFADLTARFPNLKIYQNHPLAPYTTLKIGGPADLFIITTTSDEFQQTLEYLSPISPSEITVLGNGSNVLISDLGIRGLVIKNSGQSIKIIGQSAVRADYAPPVSTQRHEDDPSQYLNFTKIDYDESNSPQIQVNISSGTNLSYAINYLLDSGITGLQWFAYIPGTIGGAIWYNLHGGNYHIHQYLNTVTYLNLSSGKTITVKSSQLSWEYDRSEFQNHPDWIILSAVFNLYQGDASRAKKTAQAWIAQKSKVQPMNSAGSVFQNPTLDQCLPIWGEQKSTGWIIDQVLGLKGYQVGDAAIGPQHANIFTNLGQATAKDYLALISKVQSEAKSKLSLDLKLEVKLLGEFDINN